MATSASRLAGSVPLLRRANARVGDSLRWASPTVVRRPASSTAAKPPKPKQYTLEKPDKFRPPSHAARMPRSKPRGMDHVGAPLTQEQKTRRYPFMMPPENSFTYKFLHSTRFHAFFAMSVLFALAGFLFYKDFVTTTEYWHLVPSKRLLPWHPIQYFGQLSSVYKLHVQQKSAETAEKRRKRVEETAKRADYRRQHGDASEHPSEYVGPFTGTMVYTGDGGKMGQGHLGAENEEGIREERPRPKVRKWFGISWN